jgi:hypothetical protein
LLDGTCSRALLDGTCSRALLDGTCSSSLAAEAAATAVLPVPAGHSPPMDSKTTPGVTTSLPSRLVDPVYDNKPAEHHITLQRCSEACRHTATGWRGAHGSTALRPTWTAWRHGA